MPVTAATATPTSTRRYVRGPVPPSRGHRASVRPEPDRPGPGYCGPYLRPVREVTPPSRPRGVTFTSPISAL